MISLTNPPDEIGDGFNALITVLENAARSAPVKRPSAESSALHVGAECTMQLRPRCRRRRISKMSRIIRCMNCNEPIAGGCCYQLDCQLCGIQQLPTAAKEAPSNLTAPRQAAPNTLGLTLLGAERVTREYFKDRPLHLHGVSRIEGHKEGLYLTFNREPTDKEFITIHELINEYIGVGNAK